MRAIPRLPPGSAGAEAGTHAGAAGDKHGARDERRETEQVLRPTSDGMGDGFVKDQS